MSHTIIQPIRTLWTCDLCRLEIETEDELPENWESFVMSFSGVGYKTSEICPDCIKQTTLEKFIEHLMAPQT